MIALLLTAVLALASPQSAQQDDQLDKFKELLEYYEEHPEEFNQEGSFGPIGNTALSKGIPEGGSNYSYVKEAIEAGWGSSVWDKHIGFRPGMDLEAARRSYRNEFLTKLSLILIGIAVVIWLFFFIRNRREEVKAVARKGIAVSLGFLSVLWYLLPVLLLTLIVLLIILIAK